MGRRRSALLALAAATALVAASCGGQQQQPAQPGQGEETPQDDLLAEIEASGVLRVSTDPKYPPQSFLDEEAGEWKGFDIEVAEELAERMGLEVEFVTPAWETIISGNWQGRWDLSVGSMTVTPERAQVLTFVEPYYYTPAAVAVRAEDAGTMTDVESDFDGKTIGVCGGCTYEFYLEKDLDIPGEEIDFVIDDAEVRTYDTDTTAIQDLAVGRLDAAISSLTTLQEAIDQGEDIEIVGNVFFEPLAAAIDRNAPKDPTRFVEEVDRIIQEMHQDGTLSRLSEEWLGQDLTKKA